MFASRAADAAALLAAVDDDFSRNLILYYCSSQTFVDHCDVCPEQRGTVGIRETEELIGRQERRQDDDEVVGSVD